MRHLIFLLIVLLIFGCKNEPIQKIVTTDIDNFWNAYDKIKQTNDTILQYKLLQDIYIKNASQGLKDIIDARGYSRAEYIEAINSYPKFWKSIRPNMSKIDANKNAIRENIQKLKTAYPDLKPSTIYFTVGVFRTGGTAKWNNVLIGSELTLGNDSTNVSELPEWRQPYYKDFKPLENLPLLCTHEYVHTQQTEIVENLLSMCLYEGIAEFISCKVTEQKSNTPALAYGKENNEAVVNKFIEDLYAPENNYNWLWGENRNELKERDLGYYIGYEISERYYNLCNDKIKAIKDLIELDFYNEKEIARIVDASRFLPKSLADIKNDYELKRPKVISISEFKNGSTTVSPTINIMTINFSEVLNGIHSALDFGPLGKTKYPNVDNNSRVWTNKNQSYTFNMMLEPNKQYQMIVSNFRLENGIRLKPYLIEFQTTDN
ncbi:DUF2268 domain-containing putative Zn-dependent protease [Psychroserpens luteus]|uniref:DUF2268 domain-containing putative Zn-dependent protease n=1 Tax=Psychroserpens luteus TaxID=1434066 RepID=A0ABW5ZR61_9FLAO|nr:DUF2268 domain-containing putative Zn-dependent protease [Psychroserpens luteus]